MRKQILSIAGILALMVTLGGASGYAQERVVAHVPFTFTVGQTALPAGDYTLLQLYQNSWVVRNSDNGKTVLTVAGPSESNEAGNQGKLVFKHYGNHYFLYQISLLDQTHQVPTSKQEREMARNGVHPEYAPVLASVR